MGYDDGMRIERHTNGFEISLKDPAIVKANKKRDAEPFDSKAPRTPYKDPNQSFVFKTSAEVVAFVKANLDKMLPEADFDTSFDLAASDMDD